MFMVQGSSKSLTTEKENVNNKEKDKNPILPHIEDTQTWFQMNWFYPSLIKQPKGGNWEWIPSEVADVWATRAAALQWREMTHPLVTPPLTGAADL